MERGGSTGSGPELVKGENGCAFAACRKSMLMKNYLEISSPQGMIMLYFLCISCIYFLKLSNQWIGGVKFTWLFELSVS